MERLVKCIKSSKIVDTIVENGIYKITSNNIGFYDYDIHFINGKTVHFDDTQLPLRSHFEFLNKKEEIINFIKKNLNIKDSNILEYSDTLYKYNYCIKYNKNWLVFLSIELKYSLPCILHTNIKPTINANNNLTHSINNSTTDSGLQSTCNLIKFICDIE